MMNKMDLKMFFSTLADSIVTPFITIYMPFVCIGLIAFATVMLFKRPSKRRLLVCICTVVIGFCGLKFNTQVAIGMTGITKVITNFLIEVMS